MLILLSAQVNKAPKYFEAFYLQEVIIGATFQFLSVINACIGASIPAVAKIFLLKDQYPCARIYFQMHILYSFKIGNGKKVVDAVAIGRKALGNKIRHFCFMTHFYIEPGL